MYTVILRQNDIDGSHVADHLFHIESDKPKSTREFRDDVKSKAVVALHISNMEYYDNEQAEKVKALSFKEQQDAAAHLDCDLVAVFEGKLEAVDGDVI